MLHLVERYRVAWNHAKGFGLIQLTFHGGKARTIQPLRERDYTALVDILRYEKPVWYDDKNAILGTYHEPVGEGEGVAAGDI